jgi:AraC-like DNA-binding protein
MNEKIVRTVKAKMEADGISQGALARQLGMQRSNLARLVNRRAGDIPRRWQEILDALGLELIAVPKEDELG